MSWGRYDGFVNIKSNKNKNVFGAMDSAITDFHFKKLQFLKFTSIALKLHTAMIKQYDWISMSLALIRFKLYISPEYEIGILESEWISELSQSSLNVLFSLHLKTEIKCRKWSKKEPQLTISSSPLRSRGCGSAARSASPSSDRKWAT